MRIAVRAIALSVDSIPIGLYTYYRSSRRGAFCRTLQQRGTGAAPCGRIVTCDPHSGGPGAPPLRHYDRGARSLLKARRRECRCGKRGPGLVGTNSLRAPHQNAAAERWKARHPAQGCRRRSGPAASFVSRIARRGGETAPSGAPLPRTSDRSDVRHMGAIVQTPDAIAPRERGSLPHAENTSC